MEILYKTCPKCEQEYPISEFWKDRSKADGRFRMCKHCAMVEKELMRDRYNARYHVGMLVRKGLLPRADTLQCVVPGCPNTPEWHHYQGWSREHWAHVLPICRSHNMKRYREQNTLWILSA